MSNRVIDFSKFYKPADPVLGGCPKCRRIDETLNIERDHYGCCHKHRTKWYLGSNLFSAWMDEAEEVWAKNSALLDGYDEVEGVWPSALSPVSPMERRLGLKRTFPFGD